MLLNAWRGVLCFERAGRGTHTRINKLCMFYS